MGSHVFCQFQVLVCDVLDRKCPRLWLTHESGPSLTHSPSLPSFLPSFHQADPVPEEVLSSTLERCYLFFRSLFKSNESRDYNDVHTEDLAMRLHFPNFAFQILMQIVLSPTKIRQLNAPQVEFY